MPLAISSVVVTSKVSGPRGRGAYSNFSEIIVQGSTRGISFEWSLDSLSTVAGEAGKTLSSSGNGFASVASPLPLTRATLSPFYARFSNANYFIVLRFGKAAV